MKKLFLENQRLLENSLSKNILSGQFTPKKTSKLAFCAFLEKFFRKKLFFFFIKVFFVSNFLKIISFWINCCKTRYILNQEFRMRQTWSRFLTTRQNSERNILERFRFRKKVLQRARFWSEIVFLKKQILMKLLLSEDYFWIVLPQKKLQPCVSRKPTILEEKIGKKTVFLAGLLQKIRSWKKFSTMRQIRIKTFKRSKFLVNFTQPVIFVSETSQRVRFWNIFFTTHQVLNGNFNNATDFHVRLVSKHQAFLDNLLSKNLFFCHFTPLKCQSWRFPTFLDSLFLRAMFWKKTCFESETSRKNRFRINFLTTLKTFKQNSYFVSKFELNILLSLEFESRFFKGIRFWWKNCF